MVVECGGVPDLPTFLPGHERRWSRRPAGHHLPPRLSRRPRRGCAVALSGLQVPARRQRLRHLRLPGHRPAVRHARRHGRAAGRSAQARAQDRDGPGGQPHLRRARVVRGVEGQGRPARRLVLVASRPPRPRARHARRRAEPVGLLLRRLRMGSTARSAASTTCTSSRRSSRISTGRTRPCAVQCTT